MGTVSVLVERGWKRLVFRMSVEGEDTKALEAGRVAHDVDVVKPERRKPFKTWLWFKADKA